ncbi:MAG TPA: hypothetical protein VMV97_07725 [Sulfuriferula sp.]|nr:hypothetical protein [Sulfuriferula sp.]
MYVFLGTAFASTFIVDRVERAVAVAVAVSIHFTSPVVVSGVKISASLP